MANKTLHNKKRLVEAMIKSMGVVQQACNTVGVSRTTYYDYYHTDEDFKEAVDDCKNIALDFAESKLLKNIEAGREASIMFYLKTQGKARGYIEKTEYDHRSGDGTMTPKPQIIVKDQQTADNINKLMNEDD